MHKILASLLSIFLISSCTYQIFAQTGFDIFDNAKKAEINFVLRNNLVVIPVTLNNRITLRFVLDSGVRGIILTEKYYAKMLGLEYDRDYNIVAPGQADSVSAHVVSNVEISLPAIPTDIIQTTGGDFQMGAQQTYDLTNVQIAEPALTAKNQSLVVLEEDYLNLTASLGIEVYGIIGYPLFRQFAIEIDHGNKSVTFHNPNYFRAPTFMDHLPLEIINSKPYINADITGPSEDTMEGKFLLDLGASHSLLLDIQTSDQLSKPELTLNGVIGHGLAGVIKGDIGRIKGLGVGSYNFDDVIVSFPDSAYYRSTMELDGRNGTIGGGILSRFNLIFNYLDSSLHVSKSIKFKEPFEHNMSGMEYRLTGQELDRLYVINVQKGSPADLAGIRFGDEVIRVNRHKVGSNTFGHIGSLLKSKEGKNIKIKLRRGFQLIDAQLQLKRQI